MTDTAFMNQYKSEWVAQFEQNYSLLRPTTVQEAVIKGNVAVFLVTGSGGAVAVTRGVNGMIPYGVISNTQNSCTLVETHAPFEKTSFNIFASQSDQKRAMQMASVAVMNRAIDLAILAQLDTATLDTGATQVASLRLVNIAVASLSNNGVPIWEEDNMFGVISGAFRAYLTETSEFSNGDYVDVKPLAGPIRKMWRWNGINWMINPQVTGVGTSSEKCYVYHRNAIGFAANSKEMDVVVDYDKKQDSSYSRSTLFMGAKLLQNSGVVQMLHDGSALLAS
jgi:hypothetical protein